MTINLPDINRISTVFDPSHLLYTLANIQLAPLTLSLIQSRLLPDSIFINIGQLICLPPIQTTYSSSTIWNVCPSTKLPSQVYHTTSSLPSLLLVYIYVWLSVTLHYTILLSKLHITNKTLYEHLNYL